MKMLCYNTLLGVTNLHYNLIIMDKIAYFFTVVNHRINSILANRVKIYLIIYIRPMMIRYK